MVFLALSAQRTTGVERGSAPRETVVHRLGVVIVHEESEKLFLLELELRKPPSAARAQKSKHGLSVGCTNAGFLSSVVWEHAPHQRQQDGVVFSGSTVDRWLSMDDAERIGTLIRE